MKPQRLSSSVMILIVLVAIIFSFHASSAQTVSLNKRFSSVWSTIQFSLNIPQSQFPISPGTRIGVCLDRLGITKAEYPQGHEGLVPPRRECRVNGVNAGYITNFATYDELNKAIAFQGPIPPVNSSDDCKTFADLFNFSAEAIPVATTFIFECDGLTSDDTPLPLQAERFFYKNYKTDTIIYQIVPPTNQNQYPTVTAEFTSSELSDQNYYRIKLSGSEIGSDYFLMLWSQIPFLSTSPLSQYSSTSTLKHPLLPIVSNEGELVGYISAVYSSRTGYKDISTSQCGGSASFEALAKNNMSFSPQGPSSHITVNTLSAAHPSWLYRIEIVNPGVDGYLEFQQRGAMILPFAVFTSAPLTFDPPSCTNLFFYPNDSTHTVVLTMNENVSYNDILDGIIFKNPYEKIESHPIQPFFSWEFDSNSFPVYTFQDKSNYFAATNYIVTLYDIHEILEQSRSKAAERTIIIEIFEQTLTSLIPFKYPQDSEFDVTTMRYVYNSQSGETSIGPYSLYLFHLPNSDFELWNTNQVFFKFPINYVFPEYQNLPLGQYTNSISLTIPILTLSRFPKLIAKVRLEETFPAHVVASTSTDSSSSNIYLDEIRPVLHEKPDLDDSIVRPNERYNDQSTLEAFRFFLKTDYFNPNLLSIYDESPPATFQVQNDSTNATQSGIPFLQSTSPLLQNSSKQFTNSFSPLDLQTFQFNIPWICPYINSEIPVKYLDLPADDATIDVEIYVSYFGVFEPLTENSQCTYYTDNNSDDEIATELLPIKFHNGNNESPEYIHSPKYVYPSGPWNYLNNTETTAEESLIRPKNGLLFHAKTQVISIPLYQKSTTLRLSCQFGEFTRDFLHDEYGEFRNNVFAQVKVVIPGNEHFVGAPTGEYYEPSMVITSQAAKAAQTSSLQSQSFKPQQQTSLELGYASVFFDGQLLLTSSNESTLQTAIATALLNGADLFYKYTMDGASAPSSMRTGPGGVPNQITGDNIKIVRFRDVITTGVASINSGFIRDPHHSTLIIFTIIETNSDPITSEWYSNFISNASLQDKNAFAFHPNFNLFFSQELRKALSKATFITNGQVQVSDYQEYWLSGGDAPFIPAKWSSYLSFAPGCFTRPLGSCGSQAKNGQNHDICEILCPTFTPHQLTTIQSDPDQSDLLTGFTCSHSRDCTPALTDFYSSYSTNSVRGSSPSLGYELPQVECVEEICQTTIFSRFLAGSTLESQIAYQSIPQSVQIPCPISSFFSGPNCDELPQILSFRSTKFDSETDLNEAFTPVAGDAVSFAWGYEGKSTNLITIYFVFNGQEYQIIPVALATNNYSSDTESYTVSGVWPSIGNNDLFVPPIEDFRVLNLDDSNINTAGPTIVIRFLTTDNNDVVEPFPLDDFGSSDLNIKTAACEAFGTNGDVKDICQNGGTCIRNSGLCKCVAPFSGPLCEIHKCADFGCSVEGSTNCDFSKRTCTCKENWGGPTCDQYLSCDDKTEAFQALQKCNNHGHMATKVDGSNNITCDTTRCKCLNQFAGVYCDRCDLICKNSGRVNSSCNVCQCEDGFFGDRCECQGKKGSITFNTVPSFINDIILSLETDADTSAVTTSFSQTQFNEWSLSLLASIRFDLKLGSSVSDHNIVLTNFSKALPLNPADPIGLRVEFIVYYNCGSSPTKITPGELAARFALFASQSEDYFSAIKNSRATVEAGGSPDTINNPPTFTDLQCTLDPETNLCVPNNKVLVPINDVEDPNEDPNSVLFHSLSVCFGVVIVVAISHF